MTESPKLASLIAGCRRHDRTSQMTLYRHYYSYGMGICLRFARSRESALEMLNDGFLRVFQRIGQYDASYAFKPWLRRVLVNAAIDHYRKYERKDTDEEASAPRDTGSTYNEALDNLEFEDLLKVMQSLPPAYRMVFNLYAVEGLSHAEIAEQLGISVGTSKSNLAKARRRIKDIVNDLWDIRI